MAKKQFIRHLEYYGFPDQNRYSSEINGVDLSELKEKDKEHDAEIAELEDEKLNKKDFNELSGTVDSLIAIQSEINQGFADSISGISSDIDRLKEIDDEFGEQISSITETVNDMLGDVDALEDKVQNIDENLISFSSETLSTLETINESLEGKLGRDEAENTYAKKTDVYTKEEVNDLISGSSSAYATKEWVEGQGYITETDADGRYARRETVDALSDRVNSAVTDLNTKVYSVSGDLNSYKESNDFRVGQLETNFSTLEGSVNRKINEISGEVQTFDSRIRTNANNIADLQDAVNRKANKSDLDNLSGTVNTLASALDLKVNKTEFDTYKSSVANQFNDFDNRKADKSALETANGRIDDLEDALQQEVSDREAGDNEIKEIISGINITIQDIIEESDNFDDRISDLESGLTKEIADRKQADLDLIGHDTDDKDADTIWGAKKYAKNEKSKAVAQANTYTNERIAEVQSTINAEHNWAEQQFSNAASKTYVDNKMLLRKHLELRALKPTFLIG